MLKPRSFTQHSSEFNMSPPSFAVSRRVNPPGATPVLTEEQVWKGLGIKARNPMTFVPMITSSEVLSDDGTKVCAMLISFSISNLVGQIVRSVRFNNGEPVKEHIELHANTIVSIPVSYRATNQADETIGIF